MDVLAFKASVTTPLEMIVRDAPVGLFLLVCGELICISEYYSGSTRDCYIVSSGENYCGGDDQKGCPIKIEIHY